MHQYYGSHFVHEPKLHGDFAMVDSIDYPVVIKSGNCYKDFGHLSVTDVTHLHYNRHYCQLNRQIESAHEVDVGQVVERLAQHGYRVWIAICGQNGVLNKCGQLYGKVGLVDQLSLRSDLSIGDKGIKVWR